MNKRLLGLGLIALAAIAGGVWLQYGAIQAPHQDDLLFASLAQKAENINHISIDNHDGVVLNAVLEAEQWQAILKEPQGTYPAEPGKLSQLVTTLMQARLSEAKTNKEQNHYHLGLQSLENKDSLASLVTLSSAQERWQVLVGKQAKTGRGQYVRLPAQTQSWLIDQNISLPLEQYDWLKQPILPFDQASFTMISRIDSQQWNMVINELNQQFVLQNVPTGRKVKYQSILDSVASNLVALNFNTFEKFEDTFWSNLEPVATLLVTLKGGDNFKVKVARGNDKTHVMFTSDRLEGYWLNWVYEVSPLSAQQLTRTVEDFLEPAPKEGKVPENGLSIIDEGEAPN